MGKPDDHHLPLPSLDDCTETENGSISGDIKGDCPADSNEGKITRKASGVSQKMVISSVKGVDFYLAESILLK